LNDPAAQREAEARPLAGRLGGEERLEDLRLQLRRNARPRVGDRQANACRLDAMLSWELDFWGKFRRGTEAARANLLGTEWAQRAVLISVISTVANAYFQLRELDLELEIARRTLASREESLKLIQIQEAGGVVSLLDVRQAEQLVF